LSSHRKWTEPAIVFGALVAAAWLAPLAPEWTVAIQTFLGVAAAGFILWSARRDAVELHQLGLRADNLLGASAAFLVPTGLLLTCLPWRGERPLLSAGELSSYFLWALFQQFLLVAGFWRHFRGTLELRNPISREFVAAVSTAGVFAAAHAPNVPLAAAVFLPETLWLILFARFRNLASLALAHAVAALALAHTLVPERLPSMTVGIRYWRP
jgi:hypothetical protein